MSSFTQPDPNSEVGVPDALAVNPVAPPQVASMGEAQRGIRGMQGKVAKVAKEEAGAYAGLADQQAAAADQETQAALDFNHQQLAPILQAKDELAAEQKKILDAQAQHRVGMEEKFAALDDHANKLALEPISDFWAHQSTGVKVTALLGQMLGGFVQGLYGGDNPVQKEIDSAMRRDLEIQKLQRAYGQQGVQNQRGIYGQMLQLFGDEDAAYSASYLTGLEGLQRRLDLNTAKYGDPKVLAANEKAKAALQMSAEPHIEKLKEFSLQSQTGLEAHAAQVTEHQASLDNALLLAQAQSSARQSAESAKQAGKRLEFAEWDGVAKTPKEYNDLNEVYANSTDFNATVAKAVEFTRTMDPTDPSSQAVLQGMLKNMFSKMRGPAFAATGANLSQNEEQNINAQLPGLFAGNVAPEYFAKLLRSTATLQTEKTVNAYQRRGLRPNQQNLLFQQYMELQGAQ